jgi:hypothetical protein
VAIRDTYFLKELELRDYDEEAKGDDVVQDAPAEEPAEPPAIDAQPPLEPPAPAGGQPVPQPRTSDETSSADNWSGALPSEDATPASSSDMGTASSKQSFDAGRAPHDEAAGEASRPPSVEQGMLADSSPDSHPVQP